MFLILFNSGIFGQDIEIKEIKGRISFISSQNIYVRFSDATLLSAGDTLFLKNNNEITPAVILKFLSSTSVAGEIIGNLQLAVGDELSAFIRIRTEPVSQEQDSLLQDEEKFPSIDNVTQIVTSSTYKPEKGRKENIYGRISAQSWSALSNNTNLTDYQRWRYSLSLNADNLSDAPISFSSYIIFAYRADDWNRVTNNLNNNLKIYDLSLRYDVKETWKITLGRSVNRKISNLGSLDGLQVEAKLGNYFGGVAAGSRPDFNDYSYNVKLFQYGFFAGRSDTLSSGIIENSLGVFEQTNNFKTDRRFLYFQHTNSAIEKLFFMISSEFDLYKKEKGVSKNEVSFTSIFVSARYAPHRTVNFSLSYDARKNVIYYETFKSFTDSVIENETRQGFRIRTNIRPVNKLMLSASAGYRFRKSDIRPSRNFNISSSYSSLPLIEASLSISYTYLMSSYLEGSVFGGRISRFFPAASIDLALGYRNTSYKFGRSNLNLLEQSVSVDVGIASIKPFYITIGYEGTFQENRTFNRVLLDVTYRF